jgi:hypothetical protein
MVTKVMEMTSNHAASKGREDLENVVHKPVELIVGEGGDRASRRGYVGANCLTDFITVIDVYGTGRLDKTIVKSPAPNGTGSHPSDRGKASGSAKIKPQCKEVVVYFDSRAATLSIANQMSD